MGDDVPTHEHPQRVVDRFGKHIEIRNILRAHWRDVVRAACYPESGKRQRQRNADECTETKSDHHQCDPLDVRDLDVDQARRHWSVFLDWVVKVEWCIEHFVDHVVARCDEADGCHPDDEVADEA